MKLCLRKIVKGNIKTPKHVPIWYVLLRIRVGVLRERHVPESYKIRDDAA